MGEHLHFRHQKRPQPRHDFLAPGGDGLGFLAEAEAFGLGVALDAARFFVRFDAQLFGLGLGGGHRLSARFPRRFDGLLQRLFHPLVVLKLDLQLG